MSTKSEQKIKYLLDQHHRGVPFLSRWMVDQRISLDLQRRYAKSGWIESIGHGVYKRDGDEISWLGAIYALHEQGKVDIHVGGLTALSLMGKEHYLRFGQNKLYTFSSSLRRLPPWSSKQRWGDETYHVYSKFLACDAGLTVHQEGNFQVRISSAERAFLECLYLAPTHISYAECYQIFEGLVNLRPELLQTLLENCRSIQVKRVFLYMNDKMKHTWSAFLDRSHVDLGKGVRSLEKGGIFSPQYNLMIPKDLAAL